MDVPCPRWPWAQAAKLFKMGRCAHRSDAWPSLMKPRGKTERKGLSGPSDFLSRQCTSCLLISLPLTRVTEDGKAKYFPLPPSESWQI